MKYNSYYLLVKPFENCSPLWYSSNNNIKVGSIVSIDLRNRKTLGIVKEIRQTYPLEKVIKIKSIEQEIFINDEIYEKFINQLTFLYQTKKETILARITNFLKAKGCEAEQLFHDTKNLSVELSKEQEIIFKEIKNSFNEGFSPHLIHGVTGSGKTSIYKKITKEILKNKRSVIITAPEITVANHLYNEIKSEIPNSYRIYTGISTKEKNDLWQALKEKKSIVIIGVHIPTLLPISNLGLIIVDEEHETGYQEKQPPYLNSKDCLMIRAAHNKIPIVLGSATPNVNSYSLFKKNNWPVYLLKERYNGEMPSSKVCYFKFDKKRESFWITSTLEKSIQENLQKKTTINNFSKQKRL